MGEFVYIWGDISLQSEQVAEWKKAKADPSEWSDWPFPFARRVDSPRSSVGSVSRISSLSRGCERETSSRVRAITITQNGTFVLAVRALDSRPD